MKAAAYFCIFSAILAWWCVTVYLVEEAYGQGTILMFFPIFRTSIEKRKPLIVARLGETGVKGWNTWLDLRREATSAVAWLVAG